MPFRRNLAEMIAEHGPPMSASEIERLSLRLNEPTSLIKDSADQDFSQTKIVVEVEPFTVALIARGPA